MPKSNAITYSWRIADLECSPVEGKLANVVKTIHWRLEASDGTHTAECYGSVGLEAPTGDEFTAYDKLSKETVVEWLEAALGDELAQFKKGLAGQIAAKAKPAVVSPGIPWEA